VARLMLIDANSLIYRAFFALPTDMATASGQVTNAVFGFCSMLVNLLKEHRPDLVAAAFDRPEPTFRHTSYAGYKQGRQETPDILHQQMGLARELLETLRIPIVEAPGFEADDVIATLAAQAEAAGDEVIVVTGDRDTFQLVRDPNVKVLYNKRGVSDYALYDEEGIRARTGVSPADYPLYAALRGDPSDNLPGAAGVGEKTAAKLVNAYGSLDNLFAHLDELSPRLKESLAKAESQVRLNAALTVLVRDAPVELDREQARLGGWDLKEVKRLFDFLEFRSLWDRFVELCGGAEKLSQGDGLKEASVLLSRVGSAKEALGALEELAESAGPVCLCPAWSGRPGRSCLVGLALASPSRAEQLQATWLEASLLEHAEVKAALATLLGASGPGYDAHDAKALYKRLLEVGVDPAGLHLDTALAAYLVDPAGDQYLLEELAPRYAGVRVPSPKGVPEGQLDLSGQEVDRAEEAAGRLGALAALVGPLGEALAARGMWELYDRIERPLVRVLAKMELVGVGVDVAALKELADSLAAEVKRLEKQVQQAAGVEFAVNSTPQLRHVLYEKLGLTPLKRTKTGYSTDAQTLEKLRGAHPIVELLLRYRELEKLRSTYGESLLSEVGPDGRIHATFNQTVARTGRLSSDQPNLHNIPVRSEEGRRFRRCFVPAPGFRFLVADYNQIELRVIAHLSGEPALAEAFRLGTDIHTVTAARVFGVDPSEVTPAMRSKAKMVSYGLAYGMEAYGLASRLSIPVPEAEEILEAFWRGFPAVKAYMDKVVAEAKDRGYTETAFGRRRHIPELSSNRYQVRSAGERQAMNAGIQGLAADIFKLSLVRLDRALEDIGGRARLVLQVHDEVILEVPPEEAEPVERLVVEAMTGAARLEVPLEVNLAWGDNWAEAKGGGASAKGPEVGSLNGSVNDKGERS